MISVWPGTLQLVLIVGVGLSCGGSPPPSAPRPTTELGPIIELRALTISQEGRPIARVLPDGRTEGTEPDSTGKPAYWVPGPSLRADGTILLTRGGFTARIERNGDIYVVSPPGGSPREQLFGRISGTTLKLASSEKPWAVRINGNEVLFNGPGFPNKIEGSVDASSQRTALVMAAAFYIDMAITGR